MNLIQFLRANESDNGRAGATFEGTLLESENDLSERGRTPVRPRNTPQYRETFNEVRKLYDRVLSGDRWASLKFQEAMTMSDFAGYFGDVLARSVLAAYAETPYTWDTYAKRATIRDFRQAKIFRFDRGASVLDGPILPNSYGARGSGPTGLQELTEYPQRFRVATNYTDQLYKFGARMDYAWETLVNDDLDALKDTPALFGRAARRTQEKRATALFCGAGGPNSAYFSTANANVITNSAGQFQFVGTNNPPLSVTALAWAMQILAMQLDLDGEPISIESYTLVVPPALDITARNIVNATQIWANDQGGTVGSVGSGATLSDYSAQRLITENWAQGRVKPVVNYYLPIVNTTNGNTAWYLFASPSNGRPAMQLSFLAGHEMPEMFMKSPNSVMIGENSTAPGGPANPLDGDFDFDSVMYKVRLVLGGTLLDPKMGVVSNGSGS